MKPAPRLLPLGLFAVMFFFMPQALAVAEAGNTLETRFATVRYTDEQELNGFIWRITGKRLAVQDSTDLLTNRVDELVERVESLLEMYPTPLHFTIMLEPHYTNGAIAEYSHHTRTIAVKVDRVTDGVLAHEMAHAVMNAFFPVPPPEKAQEILAQYVDAHLWA